MAPFLRFRAHASVLVPPGSSCADRVGTGNDRDPWLNLFRPAGFLDSRGNPVRWPSAVLPPDWLAEQALSISDRMSSLLPRTLSVQRPPCLRPGPHTQISFKVFISIRMLAPQGKPGETSKPNGGSPRPPRRAKASKSVSCRSSSGPRIPWVTSSGLLPRVYERVPMKYRARSSAFSHTEIHA